MALVAAAVLPGTAIPSESVNITRYDNPEQAPGFALEDVTGQERSLEEFEGRALVVNFWATWCVPCVQELPALERLHTDPQGPATDVVAIAVNQWAVDIEEFLAAREDMSLSFTLLPDPDGVATDAWTVGTLPTTFILDAEGRVHYKVVGDPDWDGDEMRERIAGVGQ